MSDLDDAYANVAYIPQADTYPPRWQQQAADFRTGLGSRAEQRRYGPGPRHHFDLFHPEGAAQGTMIFVHGGYWLKFDGSYWSHLAAGALAHGWRVAMPTYDLCPTVRICDITNQIASAVETIAWQCDGRLSLSGHSAGGHLVSRMLAPQMLMPETLARITHVVPISPVADLRPMLRTSMNRDFRLEMETAAAESPVLQPAPETAVTVFVGADERPSFLDQARWLADAWGCKRVVKPGKHHFNVIDALADPSSDLVTRLTVQG